MHSFVFYLAILWIAVLAGVTMFVIIRADSMITRILALDTLGVMLVAVLVLFAGAREVAFYLDAALLLALFAFIQTMVAARYHSEGVFFT